MISHKYKCIHIHIPKCAGTSVEAAFGIDFTASPHILNNYLLGWHEPSKMYLQHATPQMLLDNKIITKETWDSYYKFIIVRNPWERMFSDYIWFYTNGIKGSFYQYINKLGPYKEVLSNKSKPTFRGDHLYKQKDYFLLNDKIIKYDCVIRMEAIENGFRQVTHDLGLNPDFFARKKQESAINKVHYSLFYNRRRKKLVDKAYKSDIKFFNYKFQKKWNSFISPLKYMPSRWFIELQKYRTNKL